MKFEFNSNTIMAIIMFIGLIAGGYNYIEGQIQDVDQKVDNQVSSLEASVKEQVKDLDKKVDSLEIPAAYNDSALDRRVEKLEARPVTDTTEIEKTISVLLAKVENLSGNADTVQSIKEDVVKLKVEVEQLDKSINGIPSEFPTLQQKVDQLAEAFNKLEEKQTASQ